MDPTQTKVVHGFGLAVDAACIWNAYRLWRKKSTGWAVFFGLWGVAGAVMNSVGLAAPAPYQPLQTGYDPNQTPWDVPDFNVTTAGTGLASFMQPRGH